MFILRFNQDFLMAKMADEADPRMKWLDVVGTGDSWGLAR